MESYSIHTSVRGYHVYKDVWEAALGQLLPCQREPGNIHDPYAVAVVETGVATRIVGHVPRAISSVCYYFDHLDVTVGLSGFFPSSSRTRFTSSLAAVTLEDGITL